MVSGSNGNCARQSKTKTERRRGSTGSAIEANRRITERMREINQVTSAIADSVDQQSSATSDISRNVVNAASGLATFAEVLDQVAGAITKTDGSASTVLSAAQDVEKAAKRLQDDVEGFLRKVAS